MRSLAWGHRRAVDMEEVQQYAWRWFSHLSGASFFILLYRRSPSERELKRRGFTVCRSLGLIGPHYEKVFLVSGENVPIARSRDDLQVFRSLADPALARLLERGRSERFLSDLRTL